MIGDSSSPYTRLIGVLMPVFGAGESTIAVCFVAGFTVRRELKFPAVQAAEKWLRRQAEPRDGHGARGTLGPQQGQPSLSPPVVRRRIAEPRYGLLSIRTSWFPVRTTNDPSAAATP